MNYKNDRLFTNYFMNLLFVGVLALKQTEKMNLPPFLEFGFEMNSLGQIFFGHFRFFPHSTVFEF